MPRHPNPPKDYRCQAAIVPHGWNKHRHGRCGCFARWSINGKELCVKHASIEAFYILQRTGKMKKLRPPPYASPHRCGVKVKADE